MKQFGRNGKRSNWLRRHLADQFVKQANKEGYRSRASYKLIEIADKDGLFMPGMTVIDLGAAPGGWSQVASQKVGSKGSVYALDLLDMKPIDSVNFIQGDFTHESIQKELSDMLSGKLADVIISDISPNLSGVKTVDQLQGITISNIVLEFAIEHLKPGGTLLVKVFQGLGFEEFRQRLQENFSKLVSRKPKASRDSSKEAYLLALNYKAFK